MSCRRLFFYDDSLKRFSVLVVEMPDFLPVEVREQRSSTSEQKNIFCFGSEKADFLPVEVSGNRKQQIVLRI